MEKDARIYVAGHRGLVGSAILQHLRSQGFVHAFGRTRAELDLIDQQAVEHFFDKERPDYVFLAAARVGGIKANSTYPATFLYENLQIQNNVLTCAARADRERAAPFLPCVSFTPFYRAKYRVISTRPSPTSSWFSFCS